MNDCIMQKVFNYLYIEDQAFSSSYDWLLAHPLPPLPSASCRFLTLHVCCRQREEGVGEEPNHIDSNCCPHPVPKYYYSKVYERGMGT
jgi:hypothetical protein